MNYTRKTERASFNGTCSDDTHVLYACILVRFNLQGVPGSGKFMEQTPIGEVRFLMFPCLVYRCSGCCLARNLRHVMVPYEDEWREAGQWSQSQAGWHLCIVCMKFFESDICQWKTCFLWCFRLRKDLFVGEDSFFRQVLLSCRWSSGYSFCEVLPLRMAWDGVEAQLLYQNTSTK